MSHSQMTSVKNFIAVEMEDSVKKDYRYWNWRTWRRLKRPRRASSRYFDGTERLEGTTTVNGSRDQGDWVSLCL
jgi:hypothetical protein